MFYSKYLNISPPSSRNVNLPSWGWSLKVSIQMGWWASNLTIAIWSCLINLGRVLDFSLVFLSTRQIRVFILTWEREKGRVELPVTVSQYWADLPPLTWPGGAWCRRSRRTRWTWGPASPPGHRRLSQFWWGWSDCTGRSQARARRRRCPSPWLWYFLQRWRRWPRCRPTKSAQFWPPSMMDKVG